MITDLLLTLITTIVSGINSLIPSFSLPSFFSGGSILPSQVITFLAATLHMASPIIPSGFIIATIVALAAIWPAIMALYVFNWIYHHIPTIAGFGVGN